LDDDTGVADDADVADDTGFTDDFDVVDNVGVTVDAYALNPERLSSATVSAKFTPRINGTWNTPPIDARRTFGS
jgi:hypothetical protein